VEKFPLNKIRNSVQGQRAGTGAESKRPPLYERGVKKREKGIKRDRGNQKNIKGGLKKKTAARFLFVPQVDQYLRREGGALRKQESLGKGRGKVNLR